MSWLSGWLAQQRHKGVVEQRADPEPEPAPVTFGEVVGKLLSQRGTEAPRAQELLARAAGTRPRPGRDALGRFVTREPPRDD